MIILDVQKAHGNRLANKMDPVLCPDLQSDILDVSFNCARRDICALRDFLARKPQSSESQNFVLTMC